MGRCGERGHDTHSPKSSRAPRRWTNSIPFSRHMLARSAEKVDTPSCGMHSDNSSVASRFDNPIFKFRSLRRSAQSRL